MADKLNTWLEARGVSRLVAHVNRSAKKDPESQQDSDVTLAKSLNDAIPNFLGQASTSDADNAAWAKASLEATRKRAEGWRSGAAATLALVLASLAVKPGEGLMKYTGGTRYLLMALVAVSVLCALLSIYRLLRAANGPTWLVDLPDAAPAVRYYRRLAGARLDLQLGQWLWLASVAFFTIAVAVTWFQTE